MSYLSILAASCTHKRFLPPVPRHRKHVSASWTKRAGNFGETARGVQNMLEDVRGHDQIEGRIRKCLFFEVFATNPVLEASWRNVRKKVGRCVMVTFPSKLCGGRPPGRWLV